jgi:hypothetical protein
MADIYYDGMVAAWFVAAIADISAPKAATEIGAAGTLPLHTRLTPNGLKIPASTDSIDNSKMVSTFTTHSVGRRKFDGMSITYIKGDQVADLAFDTTLVYRASGFLVVRRSVLATVAAATGQKVEVYPVVCEEPALSDPAPNTLQEVTVMFQLTSDPRAQSNPATLAA